MVDVFLFAVIFVPVAVCIWKDKPMFVGGFMPTMALLRIATYSDYEK